MFLLSGEYCMGLFRAWDETIRTFCNSNITSVCGNNTEQPEEQQRDIIWMSGYAPSHHSSPPPALTLIMPKALELILICSPFQLVVVVAAVVVVVVVVIIIYPWRHLRLMWKGGLLLLFPYNIIATSTSSVGSPFEDTTDYYTWLHFNNFQLT